MLIDYVEAALKKAKYKILPEGEGFFGEIPGFQGVWSNAIDLESCRNELREVLESWILVRVRLGLNLPIAGGINLNQKKRKQKVA